MRFGSLSLGIVSLVLMLPSAPRAFGVAGLPENPRAAVQSAPRSVFETGGMVAETQALRLNQTLRLSGTRIETPTVSLTDFREYHAAALSAGSGGRRRTLTAVAASAVLPGLGELLLYLDTRDKATLARVPLFFALEGYLWYSYHDNHSKGKTLKREYEAFADEHWNLGRFLRQHPYCSGIDSCDSWQFYNENAQSSLPFFIFTPREMDREEYYENIGKYNAFVFGWDDWDNQSDYWTPNRHTYVDIRNESDTYLLRGDQRLMGLIVSRVVSMIDVGWIAYRTSRGHNSETGWSLHFRTYDEAPSLIISRRF